MKDGAIHEGSSTSRAGYEETVPSLPHQAVWSALLTDSTIFAFALHGF